MAERVVKTTKEHLAIAVSSYGGSWTENIPTVQFAMRTTHHRGINATPFEFLYGRFGYHIIYIHAFII